MALEESCLKVQSSLAACQRSLRQFSSSSSETRAARSGLPLDHAPRRPAEVTPQFAAQIGDAPEPSGATYARRLQSDIRNSPPPFRKRSSSCTGPRYGGRVPTIFLDRNVVYHSTVECSDYPQPPEAWWAWPHYQKGI